MPGAVIDRGRRTSRSSLWAAIAVGVVAAGLAATSGLPGAVGEAAAAPAGPLGLGDCRTVEGTYECSGLVTTWDGVPLDTTVTLPREGAHDLPLVAEIHGFGNSKFEYLDPASTAYTDNAYGWAHAGYAVLTYTARGQWGSCGTPESRLANPTACARGYLHLADTRYEVRDTQELIGRLVDQGVADARKIGVTGDSYGGGQSFSLAALSDRKMLPDGRLVPWKSPAGTPLHLAAAAPVIPWTDLVYAISPNGHTLTYGVTPPKVDTSPVGPPKASFASGIYLAAQFAVGPGQPIDEPFTLGRPMGYIAPAGVDPGSDVAKWLARALAGEPYTDPAALDTVEQLTRYHSPYWIGASTRPPPLFVASGFTDDLFPVDEAVRFLNRTGVRYPRLPTSLLVGDFGHQRASNKTPDRNRLVRSIHRWFDFYLRGRGKKPPTGAVATTQTCPRSSAPGGPFRARTFAGLARGEVRGVFSAAATVTATGGDTGVGVAIDPVAGGGDACATTASETASGTASYKLPTVAKRSYTLLGAPTIIARLDVSGGPGVAQLAGRLWDVGPDGRQTLVARGSYRPVSGRNVWQLHPGAWRFGRGHTPRLELLGSDAPFGRPSNGSFTVDVRRLQLRLPVHERPDCRTILRKARSLLPAGQRLAPGAAARPSRRCAKGGSR